MSAIRAPRALPMDEKPQEAQSIAARSSRTRRGSTAAAVWCLIVVLAAQIPFAFVWLGSGFFFYDAFTTFAPLLSYEASQLLAGIGIFNLDREMLPWQVAYPYAFANLVRQLTAVFGPATPHAHSLIQAAHILLSQLAAAFLFRTFGIRYRYGLVGGLVFVTSGIHVSLTQHLIASEALLYLVMSFAMLRLYALESAAATRPQLVLIASAAIVFLVSLVRGPHEAVLYVLPVSGWAIFHVASRWGAADGRTRKRLAAGLAIMAAAVLAGAAPMLAFTYELTQFNKTYIADFSQLGSYFPDVASFLMGLVLPHSTGALGDGAFALGHDPTLGYIFGGTLTLPLVAAFVHDALRERRWVNAVVVVASMLILAGFAFGAGSPVYRMLVTIFPPFVQIGHTHFGLHLLYLVYGFGVAAGLRAVVEAGRLAAFAAGAALVVAFGLAALGWTVIGHVPIGFSGDADAFRRAVRSDFLFLFAIVACAVAILVVARRVSAGAPSSGTHMAGRSGIVAAVVTASLSAFVMLDMLRPLADARFLPLPQQAKWAASEHGGFNPGRPIFDFLERQARDHPAFRTARVMPIFAKSGGWQANVLWTLGVALLSTPGDSGGNRYVENELKASPSPQRLEWLAEKYGIDYYWIARWGREDWQQAARASPAFKLVASDPWGGDLYRFAPSMHPPDLLLSRDDVEVGWFLPDALATRHVGLLGTTRTFVMPPDVKAMDPAPRRITLPLMWRAFFSVSDEGGRTLATFRDDLGRLQVAAPRSYPATIRVEYPAPPIQAAIAIAAVVYFAALAIALVSGLAVLRAWLARRREAVDALPGYA